MDNAESLLGKKIKRFVFPYLESNMYALVEGSAALIIDPHRSDEADSLLENSGVKDVTMLLTHEHFDHTSGISWYKEKYGARLICHRDALIPKHQKYHNRPTIVCIMLLDEDRAEEAKKVEEDFPPYTYEAEVSFGGNYRMCWQGHAIEFIHAPGHSPASCLIRVDNTNYFTGDTLIPNMATIVRWPWSDAKTYAEETVDKLLSIRDDSHIFPGHGCPVRKGCLEYDGEKFIRKQNI